MNADWPPLDAGPIAVGDYVLYFEKGNRFTPKINGDGNQFKTLENALMKQSGLRKAFGVRKADGAIVGLGDQWIVATPQPVGERPGQAQIRLVPRKRGERAPADWKALQALMTGGTAQITLLDYPKD